MGRSRAIHIRQIAVAAVFAVTAACGGGSSGSGSPTGPSGQIVGSTGSVGAIGATITISNGAVTPSQVTIAVGQSVRFVNNDSRSHEMDSDQHPSHTNCPSLNFGIIGAGQSRDSQGFAGTGTCGYHDHADPDNSSLKGRVTIQ